MCCAIEILQLQLYNIGELQSYVGDMKQHLMFIHAISGCDTVLPQHVRNLAFLAYML